VKLLRVVLISLLISLLVGLAIGSWIRVRLEAPVRYIGQSESGQSESGPNGSGLDQSRLGGTSRFADS
jgi:hypothetical protein